VAVLVLLAVAGVRVIGQDAHSGRDGRGASGGGSGTAGTQAPSRTDVLTTATTVTGDIVDAPAQARLVGPTAGVALRRYGDASTYTTGGVDHSAPSGFRLIAFQTAVLPGDSGRHDSPVLSLRIGDQLRGPLVVTSDYIVASVPVGTSDVDLLLDNGGLEQTLSLVTAHPGQNNPAVCSRMHRSARLAVTRPISMTVTNPAHQTGVVTGALTLTSVSLSYWADDGRPASSPQRAYLHVVATIRLGGDKRAYGIDAGMLQVTVTGQRPTTAQNKAGDAAAQVDDVIDVPAGTTSGSIRFGGTANTAGGTMTVTTPVVVPFMIPAG
jgi:hypothetical protein